MDGKTARSRLVAAKEYHCLPLPHPKNFVYEAISFSSRIGLHLRDANDDIITYLLYLLESTTSTMAPMGSPLYKNGSNAFPGKGKDSLERYKMGGSLYATVKSYVHLRQTVQNPMSPLLDSTTRTCFGKLNNIWDDALLMRRQDLLAHLNYYEWVVQAGDTDPLTSPHWKHQQIDKFVSLH